MPRSRGLRIAGVPVLLAAPHVSPHVVSHAAPLPTVLWFHGFRADALAHAAELERCAARGFLAVGVDAAAHGARRDEALGARVAESPGGALPVVLELIEETMRELPALVDELAATFHADRARVSVVGISMGAFLVYRAIAAGASHAVPPFRSAVALLGSPKWNGTSSAHHQLDAFREVALLSITAEHDASVPPEPTRTFHERLTERFGSRGQHAHEVLRGAGHLTNAGEWAEAMNATMRWLDRFGK